uniref:Sushi domain-containing protein n=1 Tax=Mesocestoides corti TaxID=53468 RepID=A0A0R3UCI3_MESCO
LIALLLRQESCVRGKCNFQVPGNSKSAFHSLVRTQRRRPTIFESTGQGLTHFNTVTCKPHPGGEGMEYHCGTRFADFVHEVRWLKRNVDCVEPIGAQIILDDLHNSTALELHSWKQ